jgi:hypothetical protein
MTDIKRKAEDYDKLTLANGCSKIKRPSKLGLLADMEEEE